MTNLPSHLDLLGDGLVAAIERDLAGARRRRRGRVLAAATAAALLTAAGAATAATGGGALVNFWRSDGQPIDPSQVKTVESRLVEIRPDGKRVIEITDPATGETTTRVVEFKSFGGGVPTP